MIDLYSQIQYFNITFSHVRDVRFDVTERKKQIGANRNVLDQNRNVSDGYWYPDFQIIDSGQNNNIAIDYFTTFDLL